MYVTWKIPQIEIVTFVLMFQGLKKYRRSLKYVPIFFNVNRNFLTAICIVFLYFFFF